MPHQPEVVQKAQAELDRGVGRSFSITPLAFPHKCDADEELNAIKVITVLPTPTMGDRTFPAEPRRKTHHCQSVLLKIPISLTINFPSIWKMHKDSKNFTNGKIFDLSVDRAIIPTFEISTDPHLKSLVDHPEMTDRIVPGLHIMRYCIVCSQMFYSSELVLLIFTAGDSGV